MVDEQGYSVFHFHFKLGFGQCRPLEYDKFHDFLCSVNETHFYHTSSTFFDKGHTIWVPETKKTLLRLGCDNSLRISQQKFSLPNFDLTI